MNVSTNLEAVKVYMFKILNEYDAKYVHDTYFAKNSESSNNSCIKDINSNKENLTELSINKEIFKGDAVVVEFEGTNADKCLLWFQLKKYPEIFKYISLELVTNLNYFDKNCEFKELIETLKYEFEYYGKICISIDSTVLDDKKVKIIESLGLCKEMVYENELGKGKNLIAYSMSI